MAIFSEHTFETGDIAMLMSPDPGGHVGFVRVVGRHAQQFLVWAPNYPLGYVKRDALRPHRRGGYQAKYSPRIGDTVNVLAADPVVRYVAGVYLERGVVEVIELGGQRVDTVNVADLIPLARPIAQLGDPRDGGQPFLLHLGEGIGAKSFFGWLDANRVFVEQQVRPERKAHGHEATRIELNEKSWHMFEHDNGGLAINLRPTVPVRSAGGRIRGWANEAAPRFQDPNATLALTQYMKGYSVAMPASDPKPKQQMTVEEAAKHLREVAEKYARYAGHTTIEVALASAIGEENIARALFGADPEVTSTIARMLEEGSKRGVNTARIARAWSLPAFKAQRKRAEEIAARLMLVFADRVQQPTNEPALERSNATLQTEGDELRPPTFGLGCFPGVR